MRVGTVCYATGVYCIQNTLNSKRYIGSASKSLKLRMKKHLDRLNMGLHPNEHLQNAWNKYPSGTFSFSVLERCHPDNCLKLEQKYIDLYKSYDRNYGYNKSPTAESNRGVKYSPEVRKVISKRNTGRRHTPETRQRMREVQKELAATKDWKSAGEKLKQAWKQRKAKGPTKLEIEGWAKTAAANRGKKRSPEMLAKFSKAQKGKNFTAETRAKISATLTGRKLSDDTKAKIGAALKGRKYTAEQKAVYVEAWKKRKQNAAKNR